MSDWGSDVCSSDLTVNLARQLRRQMTLPAGLLWRELRGKRTGWKFRRQFPVTDYVADFACVELRLIVVIDGKAHEIAEDRKSVVQGKSGSGRVDRGGRRKIQKKKSSARQKK